MHSMTRAKSLMQKYKSQINNQLDNKTPNNQNEDSPMKKYEDMTMKEINKEIKNKNKDVL